MPDCTKCKNAEWDFEPFPDRQEKLWFVCGCLEDYEVQDNNSEGEGIEEYDERNV